MNGIVFPADKIFGRAVVRDPLSQYASYIILFLRLLGTVDVSEMASSSSSPLYKAH